MDSVDESISQSVEESFEVDKIVLLTGISERICQRSGVTDVTKISSRDRQIAAWSGAESRWLCG